MSLLFLRLDIFFTIALRLFLRLTLLYLPQFPRQLLRQSPYPNHPRQSLLPLQLGQLCMLCRL